MEDEETVTVGHQTDIKQRRGAQLGTMEPKIEYETKGLKLKREVGLLGGLSYVVGSIIGSGIFITPQAVLRNTGSVGLCLTVWASGAVLSMLGALTFAELVSVVRKSGSQYAILMQSFGSLPAFLFVWTMCVAVDPGARAVQALTISEYLAPLLNMCGSPPLPKKLFAVTLLVFLMITNSYSVRWTAQIQIFFTAAKLLALVVIIIGGFVMIGQGLHSELLLGFEGSITKPSRIAIAFYSVMFSYSGWNQVNFIIEEIQNPRRNGSLSSILGVVIVGVVYIFTNISYLAVMTRQELVQSLAVAQTWGDRVLGSVSWIIPVSVVMSVFGGTNGGVATGTRIQFAAARDDNWWKFLSFVHVKRYTPVPAIIFHVVIACLMVFQGDITSLINFLSFSEWMFYGACALSCIILRFKAKNDPKRIKIPIVIPVLFLLCCLFLVIAPIVENPAIDFLYAAIFILGGLILYFPLIYVNLKPKCTELLDMYLQLLLEVAPSTYDPDDN